MNALRNAVAAMAVTAIGLVCANATRAEEQKLYIYSWADYIPEKVLTGFTKETGIKIDVANYESVEMAETKLLAGSSGFDLVVTAGFTVPRLVKAGTLGTLDHSKLPNIANLDGVFIKGMLRKIDAHTDHAIPFDWGLTTIGYDQEKIKKILGDTAPTDSLALLFDPANAAKLQSCGISLLDSASDVMGLALLYVGVKDEYHPTKVEFQRATDALKAVRPYVRYFDNTRYPDDLATGGLCMSMAWSNDVIRASQAATDPAHGANLKVMLPKEGALVWSDQFVMPKDAPHPEAAYAFLNYLMKAESGGEITNTTNVASPNTKASPFVRADLRDNPGVFPPTTWMQQQVPLDTFDLKVQREITRRYTEAKAGS
jgi:putrescine transport system substrate-binding protein